MISTEVLGNILLLAAFAPCLMFCILYFRVNWWETMEGRMLWIMASTDGLILALGLVRIIWRPEWFDSLRMATFVLVVAARWFQLWILISWVVLYQKRENRESDARSSA
jgi:hypothetical protein